MFTHPKSSLTCTGLLIHHSFFTPVDGPLGEASFQPFHQVSPAVNEMSKRLVPLRPFLPAEMRHTNVGSVRALGPHLNDNPGSTVPYLGIFGRSIPLKRNHFFRSVTQYLEPLGPGLLVFGIKLNLVGPADS